MAAPGKGVLSFRDQLQLRPAGKPVLGAVLTLSSPLVAQITATSAVQFIMIDAEHAPLTMDIVTQMVHAYMTVPVPAMKHALVRIPSHDVAWVKWALDSGCSGIVVPMVNSAAEMKTILDHALYPPQGRRSFGPLYAPFATGGSTASTYGTPGEYFAKAKRGEIAIIPMIESKEGLENCADILALEGVDGCFIGPADLRLSLGLPPALDGAEPPFIDALQQITSAAKKYHKFVGTMGIGEQVARKRAAEGMDFLLSTFDFGALSGGYAADIARAEAGIANTDEERPTQ